MSDKPKGELTIRTVAMPADANPAGEKEEYEEKQKALEGIAMPILQNMAGGAGAGRRPLLRRSG